MKKTGFSLIELTTVAAISGFAIIYGISLYQAQDKERRKEDATNAAFSQIRQFFDLRRKILQTSNQLSFTSFNESGQKRFMKSKDYSVCAEGSTDCQENYRVLTVKGRSPVCEGAQVEETVEVECVAKNPVVPEIKLEGMAGPGAKVFELCSRAACAVSGGILGKAQASGTETAARLPRIKINRKIPKTDASGNCLVGQVSEVISYFPPSAQDLSSDGRNGNPVAAVVCMQVPSGKKLEIDGIHCGTPLAGSPPPSPLPTTPPIPTYCIDCERSRAAYPTAQQATYDANCPIFRDFNITVFAITKYGENNFDVVQQVANFARPKIEDPNGVKILQQVPGKF